MSATTSKLTIKQSSRLQELEQQADIKVTGWDAMRRGPIIQFNTGASYVVTRDGGLDRL